MSSAFIRCANPDDAAALATLARRTFVETFVEGFQIPYPPSDLAAYLATAFADEPVQRSLEDASHAWWVAERAGELVAFANTGPMSLPHAEGCPTHAELRRLYVTRAAQGLGLGTRLLDLALAWMQEHTDGPLWIGVWSGNAKAQRLYSGYGFAKVGQYKYPVGAWHDEEWILRRG